MSSWPCRKRTPLLALPDQRLPQGEDGARPRVAGRRALRRGRDHYFAEYRGKVEDQRPGDRVEVWVSASKPRRAASRASTPPT